MISSAATARKLDFEDAPGASGAGMRSTRKCQYLVTDCKSCGKSLTVGYPTSVTFWKFRCDGCSMDYSIDIVGHRKCLVYQLDGRKTIERIGLSDSRNRFYRAKCYGCAAPTIVSEGEMGQVASCGKCGLDYTIRRDGEVYYETVVRHNGHAVTYRDRVQELSGHIIHKKNAFFLDEDLPPDSNRELLEELAALEGELSVLQRNRQDEKQTLMRLHAEKEALREKLQGFTGKSADMASRVLGLEGKIKVLRDENRLLTGKLKGHEEAVRELDAGARRIKELETKNGQLHQIGQDLEKRVKALFLEKKKLTEKVSGFGSMALDLDRFMTRCGELEGERTVLNQQVKRLGLENERLGNKLKGHGALARDLDRLNRKQRELENENQTLLKKLQRADDQRQRLESRQAGYNELLRDFDSQRDNALKMAAENQSLSQTNRRLRRENGELARESEKQREATVKMEQRHQELDRIVKRLEMDNKRLTNRLNGQGEIVQDLDQQTELVSRLEVKNFELSQKVRRLESENRRFAGKVSAYDGLVRNLERQREKAAWAEMSNSELTKRSDRLSQENERLKNDLQEHKALTEKLEKHIKSGSARRTANGGQRVLEQRIKDLEREKNSLEKKLSEASFFQESFINLGKGRDEETGKSARGEDESWYCEEGCENGISLSVRGGRERRILGIKGEPTPKRIKSALRKRIKKYHPDMIASMGKDLRELAHQKTQEINQAYTSLMAMYG